MHSNTYLHSFQASFSITGILQQSDTPKKVLKNIAKKFYYLFIYLFFLLLLLVFSFLSLFSDHPL
jgi:hypothetical protein